MRVELPPSGDRCLRAVNTQKLRKQEPLKSVLPFRVFLVFRGKKTELGGSEATSDKGLERLPIEHAGWLMLTSHLL